MTASITVPAVAAALLTVPRDCETCGNSRMALTIPDAAARLVTDLAKYGKPCPDCRMVCEWLAVDDPLEVGSTIHIVEGATLWSFDQQAAFVLTHPTLVVHWRPGVVVATGVVTECVPIIGPDDDRPTGRHIAPVYLGDGDRWYLCDQHLREVNDITDQRLDQDWSPTRPCPAGEFLEGQWWCDIGCDTHCAVGGTLPRYAIRLTDVEARP